MVASNIYWPYVLIGNKIALSYRDHELYEYKETQKQLMMMLSEVAGNRSKDEIIRIAQKYSSSEPFEKQGCTWVGWLGFKFSESSELEGVSGVMLYGKGGVCEETH